MVLILYLNDAKLNQSLTLVKLQLECLQAMRKKRARKAFFLHTLIINSVYLRMIFRLFVGTTIWFKPLKSKLISYNTNEPRNNNRVNTLLERKSFHRTIRCSIFYPMFYCWTDLSSQGQRKACISCLLLYRNNIICAEHATSCR